MTWEDGDSIKQLVSCQFIFQSFKTLKSLVCFNCKLDWKKLTNTLTTCHYSSTFNQSILYLRGMLLGFMISIIHHLLSNLLLLWDQSSRHKRMRRSRKTISKCLCESYYFWNNNSLLRYSSVCLSVWLTLSLSVCLFLSLFSLK